MNWSSLRQRGQRILFVGLCLATVTLEAVDTTPLCAEPPRRLTENGRRKSDPVFVRGGREIVFTELERFDQLSLQRLDLESGQVERVHPGVGNSEFGIAFSADERKAAYLHNDGNLHVKIVIEDLESKATVDFNPGGGFAAIRDVSIAPDGSRVLFAFPEKGAGQQIFALTADGMTLEALTDGESFDVCPQFSADGRWIAYASTRAGNFDIWTMSAAGTGAIRLTQHEGLDTRPAWSPDGKQLAFTSLRDGNYDIYVIQADGSNLRRVTEHPEMDDHPCWHPDGKHLVIVSERDGRQDLYLVPVPEASAPN